MKWWSVVLSVGVLAVAYYTIAKIVQSRDEYNPNNWIHNHAERAWRLRKS
jgi:hypothetical protein